LIAADEEVALHDFSPMNEKPGSSPGVCCFWASLSSYVVMWVYVSGRLIYSPGKRRRSSAAWRSLTFISVCA
jgi:hypothetical protein